MLVTEAAADSSCRLRLGDRRVQRDELDRVAADGSELRLREGSQKVPRGYPESCGEQRRAASARERVSSVSIESSITRE